MTNRHSIFPLAFLASWRFQSGYAHRLTSQGFAGIIADPVVVKGDMADPIFVIHNIEILRFVPVRDKIDFTLFKLVGDIVQ